MSLDPLAPSIPIASCWPAEQAARHPHATALVASRSSWTYAQLEREALARASRLAALATPGTRVAFLAANGPEYVFWLAAAQMLGVSAMPLNVRLSALELGAQLADGQPAALLHDGAHSAAARAALDALGEASTVSRPHRMPRLLAFDQALSLPCAPCKPAPYDPDRVATVMYTSGSTGAPKGVLQTFANHWHSARMCRRNLRFSIDDVWACPTPLFHMSGLSILMRSLACGVAVRLYGRFDAAELNDDILAGRVTGVSAVTYQIERLLDDMENRGLATYPPSLRFVLQGGGPLPADTLARCRMLGMPVAPSFGMTETASQVVAFQPDGATVRPGASGRPLDGVRLRIASQGTSSSKPVVPGEDGRILIKSPTIAAGYLNQPERFAASFTDDGWFDTGDLGHLDAEGLLHVSCRLADLIVSGGENVYPAEVEAALVRHPAVAAAAVAGAPDPVWGSVPVAVCVRKGAVDGLPTADELNAFCRRYLASYKCPRRVVWVDDLPRTASGKLKRSSLLGLVQDITPEPSGL